MISIKIALLYIYVYRVSLSFPIREVQCIELGPRQPCFLAKIGLPIVIVQYYGYIRCAYPFRHRGMHIFIFFVTKALKLCQVAVVAMLKNCRVPRSGNTCTQWGGSIYVKIIIFVYATVYKMFIFTVGPKNMERRKLSRLAQMKVFPTML